MGQTHQGDYLRHSKGNGPHSFTTLNLMNLRLKKVTTTCFHTFLFLERRGMVVAVGETAQKATGGMIQSVISRSSKSCPGDFRREVEAIFEVRRDESGLWLSRDWNLG